MQSNKGRDTSLELGIRKDLFRLGYRYRVNYRPVATLRRTADIVFTRKKVAIFLDGCFWHGCPTHYTVPKANAAYWAHKVAANVDRDAETTRLLTEAGWSVLRFWEHRPADEVVAEIVNELNRVTAESGAISPVRSSPP
ncbi:very short patch repair endonuclease [Agromyces salentinus]|uniref:Very short patch repair endonuclease n=2 Tax=Agromyces salentinus TaxID=269421 RepID=A0ABN2MK89_9MICO